MAEELTPHFIDLIKDALLKSFWRKNSLVSFLRRMRIAESTLSSFREDESKRDWLNRLFPAMEQNARGPEVLNRIAIALADQTSFPDLANWENSEIKIEAATDAVKALNDYIAKKKKEAEDERLTERRKKEAKESQALVQRSFKELETLKARLEDISTRLGTQAAGYEFQNWFYDLMNYFEVINRRPYVASGRQIDGSVTIDGTTYIVELKFTKEQSGSPDIDSLKAKVLSKADNTMGIMVSISGYSSVAIEEASGAKSPLLLTDASHIYHVLMNYVTFTELVNRVRRHSAQEGKAYLEVSKFGG